MPQLEVSDRAVTKLKELSQQAQKPVDDFLLWLLDNYSQSTTLVDDEVVDVDVTWTPEEIKEMLKPKKALTGREIVEKGLLGAWKDKGITDGIEWVAEQRARRRNKFQW